MATYAATSRALIAASHRSSSLGGFGRVAIPTYTCACVHASFKLKFQDWTSIRVIGNVRLANRLQFAWRWELVGE